MRRFNILFFAGNLVLLGIIGFRAFPAAQAQDSAIEANIAHSERYISDIWNRGDIEAARELWGGPVLLHNIGDGPEIGESLLPGPGFQSFHSFILDAFPDSEVTVNNIIANEEYAVIQYTFRGTYEDSLPGSFTPFPPTGEEVTWDGVFVHRFEEGRLVEAWWYWDNHTIVFDSLPEKIWAIEPAE